MNDKPRLERFIFWCQKVIPLVYDDSLSYYEVLCKVVHYINKLIEDNRRITEVLEIHEEDIAILRTDMDYMLGELEKIKNGDYMDIYINALIAWIDANIQTLIGRIVKYTFFGLTDDGHFCAWIPDKWQFLTFDTIMDIDSELYGHLTMRW